MALVGKPRLPRNPGSPGETDYDAGSRKGQIDNSALMVHLTIATDVARFVTDPQHEASLLFGAMRSAASDRGGGVNLLVDTQIQTAR